MIKKTVVTYLFLVAFMLFLSAKEVLPELSLSEIILSDLAVTVSMDFKDASLKDILKVLSIQSGLNFISSQAVQDRKITLYLDKVPVKEAMDQLFKANNLTYELNENARIFIVKDWGLPDPDKPETITKVFSLKYHLVPSSSLRKEKKDNLGTASSGDILSAIKEILTDKGKVSEDSLTNSLIVTDIPSRFAMIEETIKRLDVAAPQVILEVEMLDVSKNSVDKLGVKFGQTPLKFSLSGAARQTKFPFGGITPSLPGREFAPGAINFANDYEVLLDFLKTQTDTKYLARPRILTMNNETAEIQITTDESIGVETSATANTGTENASPERTKTGISLRVTPQINMETGEITMFIYPKVTEAVQGNILTSADKNYQFRDPEERSTKATVRIRDNETVVIGGLIRNEYSLISTKLPILGDIPVFGALFRHKNKNVDRERELLVFITPRIVREGASRLVSAEKFQAKEREQATKVGFDRQRAINGSLNYIENQNKNK